MQQKYILSNEKLRRAALAEYAIFNSGADKDFDQLSFLAAKICDVPVAKINIIGKNKVWYKAAYGTKLTALPRKNSFSELCIKSGDELFMISCKDQPDIFEHTKEIYDRRYQFYAGVPMLNPNGYAIAVFAIFDTKVRSLTADQKQGLLALAHQAMNLFEARKYKNKLGHVQRKLKQKYRDLEKFSSLVSHDIKSPLANIISLSELLRDENSEKLNEQTEQYLDFIVESSYSLRNYVDGILSFYRSDHVLEKDYENVWFPELIKNIADLYALEKDIDITFPMHGELENINKMALSQVFMNLISNGLKYNYKENRKIVIHFEVSDSWYHFKVQDNGEGIKQEDTGEIFKLFSTLDTEDREGDPGSGIGLATVKKHIEQMQGSIEVDSEKGKGSTFKFKIKRR